MKKLFSVILLTISGLCTFAQKSDVLAAFRKYGFDPIILETQTRQRPANYAYDLKYTSITGEKENVSIAKFDPSKPEGEQWSVVSVKGKSPSASDIKTFKKEHSKPPANPGKTDENTYKIEKDNTDYMVISYKQDPASIPSEASFMKDCRHYITINKKTKRLEKLQSLNEKPLKIKILKAEKLDLVVKYNYNESENIYLTESEDLNLMVKLLGQLAPFETISEYTNYKKI
jgi:hypothetical protein